MNLPIRTMQNNLLPWTGGMTVTIYANIMSQSVVNTIILTSIGVLVTFLLNKLLNKLWDKFVAKKKKKDK